MTRCITVNDLKMHIGVTDEQLALQCSYLHFSYLAPKVPNWLSLAIVLGLEEYQRQAIKVDLQLNYLNKTLEVLVVWKKNLGQEATYLRLVRGCLDMSNAILAGEICKLAKTATASSRSPHSLEDWFKEVGLMGKDIDILTSEGYATKQAFNLLTIPELNKLGLSNGGVKLLKLRVSANESQAKSCSIVSVPAPTECLDTSIHLKNVYSHTFEARTKWVNIGLQLDLAKHTLDSISRNSRLHDDGDYYREMLTSWMQTGEAKMEDLLEALKGPSVEMSDVARKVRELDDVKKNQLGL